jgi:hypothetical protein
LKQEILKELGYLAKTAGQPKKELAHNELLKQENIARGFGLSKAQYRRDVELARRNLSPEQMSYLRGVRYKLEKQEHGGHLPKKGSSHFDNFPKTAEKIAKETGVSSATILRDAKFVEAIDKLPEEIS